MKKLLLLLVAASFLAPLPVKADVPVNLFYSTLQNYGEWLEHPVYGYCWRPFPQLVYEGWRPYSDGYWAYTDAGWAWVSYEDWGWATYHYGRWVYLDEYGWLWVPGEEWAPAWVSWRTSDDYIGWAPLPPAATFEVSVGFSTWVDDRYDIGPGYYNFCEYRHFGSPSLRNVILPSRQNVNIIYNTVNVTNIVSNQFDGHRRVYNGGPDYDRIRTICERPVPRYRIKADTDPSDFRNQPKHYSRPNGNELEYFAPGVKLDRQVRPEKIAQRIDHPSAPSLGWHQVGDAKERDLLRSKFRSEAGPDRKPARSVEQAARTFTPDPTPAITRPDARPTRVTEADRKPAQDKPWRTKADPTSGIPPTIPQPTGTVPATLQPTPPARDHGDTVRIPDQNGRPHHGGGNPVNQGFTPTPPPGLAQPNSTAPARRTESVDKGVTEDARKQAAERQAQQQAHEQQIRQQQENAARDAARQQQADEARKQAAERQAQQQAHEQQIRQQQENAARDAARQQQADEARKQAAERQAQQQAREQQIRQQQENAARDAARQQQADEARKQAAERQAQQQAREQQIRQQQENAARESARDAARQQENQRRAQQENAARAVEQRQRPAERQPEQPQRVQQPRTERGNDGGHRGGKNPSPTPTP